MKKNRGIFFLTAVAAAWLCGGCFSVPLRHTPDSYEPIKLGLIVPLSGFNAAYGIKLKRGVEMAVEDLNNGSGVAGRQLRLCVADSESLPDKAAALVGELYHKHGIVGLIAGYSTEEIARILPEAIRLHLPTVNMTATATAEDFGHKPSPLVIRASFTDDQQGHALAAYLIFWRSIRSAAILNDVNPDNLYARNTAKAFRERFLSYNGRITRIVPYEEGKDYQKAIQQIVQTGPQAVFIPASPCESGKMLQELRRQGFNGIAVGPDCWEEEEFLKNCGSDPGECIFTGFYAAEYDTKIHRDFHERFRKKYFYYPTSDEAQGYDSVQLLGIALGSADTVAKFQKNVMQIRGYFGVAGQYSLLKKNDIDRTIFLNTLQKSDTKNGWPEIRLVTHFPYSHLKQFEDSVDHNNESWRK